MTVELHEAFFWTCEDCGLDNFVRAVELSPEQADALGLPRQWIDGTYLTAPAEVTCSECGATYHAHVEETV